MWWTLILLMWYGRLETVPAALLMSARRVDTKILNYFYFYFLVIIIIYFYLLISWFFFVFRHFFSTLDYYYLFYYLFSFYFYIHSCSFSHLIFFKDFLVLRFVGKGKFFKKYALFLLDLIFMKVYCLFSKLSENKKKKKKEKQAHACVSHTGSEIFLHITF